MENQGQFFRAISTNPSKQETCSTRSIATTANTSRSSLSSLGFFPPAGHTPPPHWTRRNNQGSRPSFYSTSCLDLYGNYNMDNHAEGRTDNIYHSSPTRDSYSDHQTSHTLHRMLDESKTHQTNSGKSDHDFNVMMQAPLVHTPAGKNRSKYDQDGYLPPAPPLSMHDTFPMASPMFKSTRTRYMEEPRANETSANPLLSDVAFSNAIGSTRAMHKFNDFDLFTNPFEYDQMTPTTATSQQQELNIHPSDRQSGTYFTNAVFDNLCKVLSSPSDQNLRQKMPIGFPGLACLHCQGLSRKRNGGRYFPSSLKTLSDSKKTLFAIYQHLQNCDKCPEQLKKDLQTLMSGHEEERRKQRRGSQTSYFVAVWQAIHNGSLPPDLKRRKKSP